MRIEGKMGPVKEKVRSIMKTVYCLVRGAVFIAGFLLAVALLAVPTLAASKVLPNIPAYTSGDATCAPPPTWLAAMQMPATVVGNGVAHFDPKTMQEPPLFSSPLGSVPTYVWWYGCAPTAGGMLIGYWDSQPGFGNLYEGDASVWGGDGGSGTRRMVASTAHISAGSENGHEYGDWHNSTLYPTHEANPDCIADFMKTVDGGAYVPEISAGIKAYAEWDDPTTATNEAYPANSSYALVDYYTHGTFTYEDFKSEIDAGRPMLLGLDTNAPAPYSGWVGHAVLGFGYQDDMFELKIPTNPAKTEDVTVPGFAVMDTWDAGTIYQSDWVDWSDNTVDPFIDGDGVEWWPFLDKTLTKGYSHADRWDWVVSEGIFFEVVPEPATMGLMLIGLGGIVLHRRKR